MQRLGAWLGVGMLIAALGGCATRPYAADPLIRNGGAVWGDAAAARRTDVERPPQRPTIPPPPPDTGNTDLHFINLQDTAVTSP